MGWVMHGLGLALERCALAAASAAAVAFQGACPTYYGLAGSRYRAVCFGSGQGSCCDLSGVLPHLVGKWNGVVLLGCLIMGCVLDWGLGVHVDFAASVVRKGRPLPARHSLPENPHAYN